MVNTGDRQAQKNRRKGDFFVEGENNIDYLTLAEPLNSEPAPRVSPTTIR